MSLRWFSIDGKLKLYNFFSTLIPIVLSTLVYLKNSFFMNPATSFEKNVVVNGIFFGTFDCLFCLTYGYITDFGNIKTASS